MGLVLGADNPLGHVVDRVLVSYADGRVVLMPEGGVGTPIVTLHMVTLIAAAALTLWVLVSAAKRIGTGPESAGVERYLTKGRVAQMVETICVYLREKVIRPQLGANTGKFTPYLWSVFFFVLFNNLLGLVPLLDAQHLIGLFGWGDSHWAVVGGTATGNIAVTAALALVAFVIIQVNGLRENGLKGYLKHYMGGAPVYLAPLMIPVEIMGTFIKPFALAIRLFANMVAGHTLLATLLMFTKMGLEGAGLFAGGAISLVSVVSAIAIMFLELFVAFLQAFVFMFLVTVFIAQLSHHGEADHGHAHHPEDHGVDPHAPAHSGLPATAV